MFANLFCPSWLVARVKLPRGHRWRWELSFWGPPGLLLRKRDKEVPLETSLRFSEEESPPTTMRAGLLPAPQWLFLKRLLYSFSILVSGRQSPSLTQRLDLLDPERASWSLCYGRFIAPCSKERLQSHASPCTHHISSSLPAYIDLVLFPYCFRFRKRER